MYPDRDNGLRPKLPEVEDPDSLPRRVVRGWLRQYFNYLWGKPCSVVDDVAETIAAWLGGKGSVPWSRLEADQSYWFIERTRLPANITCLTDPHGWSRQQLTVWYLFIIAGQQGTMPHTSIFQFRRVNHEHGSPEYQELQMARPECCRLTWGPEEKLYVIKLHRAGQPNQTKNWHGLPLARTSSIYEPYNATTRSAFRDLTLNQIDMSTLASAVAELERKGPVHVG